MKRRAVWLILLLGFAMPARAGVLDGDGIGVYGDSMSMQYSLWLPLAPTFNYSVYYNGTQLNWVDLLSQKGYNFGPTITDGTNSYKQYDVAISGQKSSDLNNQVLNLQDDVTAGNIKLVVLMMGSNDVNSPEYSTVYNAAAKVSYNPLNNAGVQAFMADVISNITATVDATLAENPATHMILATIPDVGVTPEYRANYPNATQRAAMTVVTQAINEKIIDLAAEHHFPVVDMFAVSQRSLSPLTVGGVSMINAGGKAGRNEYLSDGFHPSTVIQGLMANGILMADHIAYGDPVTYLTDQFILDKAGVSHSKATTYFDVSPFIIYSPVPEPSSLALVMVGFAGIALALLTSRNSRNALDARHSHWGPISSNVPQ